MDRWADFSKQIDQAFAGNSPRAGQPGPGAGNVPHAPGIMSGKYPGISPEAHQMYSGVQSQMPQPSPMGQPGMGTNPSTPPGAGPQQPAFNPMAQAQIIDYLMRIMTQRVQGGSTSPISSTGTF